MQVRFLDLLPIQKLAAGTVTDGQCSKGKLHIKPCTTVQRLRGRHIPKLMLAFGLLALSKKKQQLFPEYYCFNSSVILKKETNLDLFRQISFNNNIIEIGIL